ncbi:MAG TPA: DNA mismatch repair protein MutS, partial [Pyrinomonadaceae bacterium]|nr:DNA mismatch repair protein MutS [Pyrinomonadaceae bacterium]
PGLLQSKVNNYLAAFVTDGKRAGMAYADVTTGDFAATEVQASAAAGELQRIGPSELLVPSKLEYDRASLPGFITRRPDATFDASRAKRELLEHFGARTVAPFGLSKWPLAVAAAGALVAYLRETQGVAAAQLTRLTSYRTEGYMTLDEQTVRSLEIFDSSGGAPSLLQALDETRTAMGGRLLRRWLRQPLLDAAEIVRRQEHVAWLASEREARAELFAALDMVHDVERLAARTRAGLATPSEVLALGQSLEMVPRVRAAVGRDPRRFGALLAALPACESVVKLISSAINDALPSRSESYGVIRDGYSEELDSLRKLLRDGKTFLAEMEQRERARTGIRSLRVGYNKVFGYFIEVTRPNLHLVPDGFTRKQTLAASERFITLELKEHESLVLNAQERIAELEQGLFRKVCAEIGQRRDEILAAASSLAHLDVVASLAHNAERWEWVRPEIVDAPELRVTAGRHPVIERGLEEGREFVPNDVRLGGEDGPQVALLTGPNMSGKSTYLRQTALIALLAQVGSFVPARRATVGITDRIYTRIGLYDRIGRGESTFMTEMVETAHILHHATPASLVLLDELGRGTSTYDGLAVARAVLEYLHNHPHLRPRTLFATHYHELTEMADVLPRVENLHVAVAEEGSEIVFLYKISPGAAGRSFGVYAAKLAGLPRPVIRRAEVLLREYESRGGAQVYADAEAERALAEQLNAPAPAPAAATMTSAPDERLARALDEVDPDALSPVEALMKLFELKKLAESDRPKNVRAIKTA